jgi:hypothetical protein
VQQSSKIQKRTSKTEITNEENIDIDNTKAFDNIEIW